MSYRIVKGDGGVQDGVRRIAAEQVDRALAELDDDALDLAEKVHQVRKRCKKLRGLVRLVRPAFDGYDDENRAFRDAARSLSGVRDARTLIETYDVVAEHFDEQIDRRAFAPIRARLTRDARKLREDPGIDERLRGFRRAMEAARDRVPAWTLDEEGFDAIAGGLAKSYRRAREAMERARSDPDAGTLHDWRKRVKYHWYHARLLGDVAPAALAPHVDAVDELSDLLGDHHDLAVLEARLGRAPGDFGTRTDVAAFRALARERRDALAARAFAAARVPLAERPTALVERWRVYWDAWSAG